MSKYKVLKDNLKNLVGEEFEKTLPIIAGDYEDKIKRQAAEITRLLAENKRLKAENGNSLWNIEQARAEGAEAAWELAKKILFEAKQGGMEDEKYKAIFGSGNPSAYVIKNHTYSEAAAKVAEWEKAKAKPQKTILMDLLEKLPNIETDVDGLPKFCSFALGYDVLCSSKKTCKECWNRPFEQKGGEE